ncbi:MAG: hypothetical protein KHX27_10560 [Alistipes sp.]|jgi:hypothetical protein|nr:MULTISPECIES: hypothetical protein [Alistipes]MBS5556831.1 hypothetical protein [Alistipes sp.]
MIDRSTPMRLMFENLLLFAHTQIGVLSLFGHDVGIVVANRLIVFADLNTDIIQIMVDALRLDAFAFGTPPPLISHSCSETLILALNCEIVPLIVMRPITG